MVLINLTPHEVVLIVAANTTRRLPPATRPARIVDLSGAAVRVAGVPVAVRRRQFGTRVDRLPAARTGVYYVVSRAVAMVAATRTDLLVPGPLHALADGTLGCAELHRFDPA